uniref:Uncharacterized protein n=1 Tax=Plectus sambesii TaxID=2011161 RepID=A0A914V3E4_9BILA
MMIRTCLEQKGSVKLRAMTIFILDNACILFDHVTESLKQAAATPIASAVVKPITAAEPKQGRTRNNSEPKRDRRARVQRPIVRRRRRGSSSEDGEDGDDDRPHSASPISEADDTDEDDDSDVHSERDDGADIVELSDSSDDEQGAGRNRENTDARRALNGATGDGNKTDAPSSNAPDKLEILRDCEWLKVVKLTVDWLRFSISLITSPADERHPIWKALANLLNVLPSEQDMSNRAFDGVLGASESGDLRSSHKWQQKDVMPEDVLVRGVAVFDSTHAAFDWDERCRLSPAAQVANRLLAVRSFGRHLAEMKLVGFAFDRDTALFSVQTADKKNNLLPPHNDASPVSRP